MKRPAGKGVLAIAALAVASAIGGFGVSELMNDDVSTGPVSGIDQTGTRSTKTITVPAVTTTQ